MVEEQNLRKGQPDKQQAAEQQARIKEAYLRMFLTSEARQRLSNVRMVKPELAQIVEDQIIQLGTTGRLRRQIDDEELKNILSKLSPGNREFRIKFA
ncbi:MAG: DNA-binding protein [Conexivisphaerales archaeon]